MVIKGEKGILVTDMLNSDINFYDSSGSGSVSIRCRKEIMTDSIFNELLHFYDCVKKRSKPDTDIDDSIETLAIVEAAYVASEEKRAVDVTEVRGRHV